MERCESTDCGKTLSKLGINQSSQKNGILPKRMIGYVFDFVNNNFKSGLVIGHIFYYGRKLH